jgi:uncharacterized membrane protein YqjE
MRSPADDVLPPAPKRLSLFALLCLLRSTGPALLAQASLHSELIQQEWAQEKNRLGQLLLTALFGFACVLILLLLASALVLAASWATPYRWFVASALLLLYGLGVALAGYRLRRLVARGTQSFADTSEELAADLALIRSRL